MEKVQRGEGAKQAGEQQAEQHEVSAWPVGVLPRSKHNERCEQRREQQHQRVRAVEADEIVDAKRRDPRCLFAELQAFGSGVKLHKHPHRQSQ